MKIIITESQELWILRRYKIIKDAIDEALLKNDPVDYSLSQYIDEISRDVIFSDEFRPYFIDYFGVIKKIQDFVTDNFSDYIEKYYRENS